MPATNKDVARAFAMGRQAKAANLESRCNYETQAVELYSYRTLIAVGVLFSGGRRYFTDAKYTQTTSKQQSQARAECERRGLPCETVPAEALHAYLRAGASLDAQTVLQAVRDRENESASTISEEGATVRQRPTSAAGLLYGTRRGRRAVIA